MVMNAQSFDSQAAGTGLRVVLYLRNSGKQQEVSVEQQRNECRAYAHSRNWTVVDEFVDADRTGSKEIERRLQFHRLIADAEKPDRKWDAVLCWDTSRF